MNLRYRIGCTLTLVILCLPLGYGQRLPHALTEQERHILLHYTPPASVFADTTPPPTPARAMAEWEELQAVVIAWANYPTVPAAIVRYAQEECTVVIVCEDSTEVIDALTTAGVPITNVRFLIAPYDSEWCRDYGPTSVYTNGAGGLRFVDAVYNRPRPNDDTVSSALAQWFNVPLHEATIGMTRLVSTGGNFMTDGHGTAFSSDLVLEENPDLTESGIDSLLDEFMGIQRYVLLQDLPYDEIHHIDMHMKLLDEETLLVGQYPVGVADGPVIENNLQTLTATTLDCYHRPYRIIRIPMPPDSNGAYPPVSSYNTYTNSVILNKSVLVPVYGLAQDSLALAIYRSAMPGYRVVGINCNEIIPSGGAIHCITKEVGVRNQIWISHAPLRVFPGNDTTLTFGASATSSGGPVTMTCFWKSDSTAAFTATPMSAAGDSFLAVLHPIPHGKDLSYYLEAHEQSGHLVTKPPTAPAAFYIARTQMLTAVNDDGAQPFQMNLEQNFPNPFNPSTTIEYTVGGVRGQGLGVSVKIYDVLGREVAVLVHETQRPGRYRLRWDAGSFSSGIYICQMRAGDFTASRKMVIVK